MTSCQFCCMTFLAKERSNELCGSNGLPLTPNSIKILGRAQYLLTLDHRCLCTYIDVLRGKHERIVAVCEKLGEPLSRYKFKNWWELIHMIREILQALSYLNKMGIVHRCLSPGNIFLVNECWKLYNYGLYYMTGNGADVSFPMGETKYTALDVLLNGPTCESSHKSDIWSLGMILAEICLKSPLWDGLPLKELLKRQLRLQTTSDVFHSLADQCGKSEVYYNVPGAIRRLISSMLALKNDSRPNSETLLDSRIFRILNSVYRPLRPHHDNLNHNSIVELYHYWQLAGGDIHVELKKNGLVHNRPPILSLPNLLMLEGRSFGQKKNESTSLDQCTIVVTVDHLIGRFRKLPECYRYPESDIQNGDRVDASTLPLLIKERDTDYQFKRIQLFKNLLNLWPELNAQSKDKLFREARKDIPPLVRAEVWAFILAIPRDYQIMYDVIDKETPVPTDRQIEVDIPRCHQYNELLSSNVGHVKFKRILKAWVTSHPQYVYWQGLDSLCAPFLFLNFRNEARAYASLTNFINKYLYNFFLKDNSLVIKEYLAKFGHLIAFQDPILASHLRNIGFSPELFAIPWFLTMFSHVFPIHKVLHLWDSLLLGDASYPLYIGLSLLQQLRPILLDSGFNECILLFSDLPEIDIEKCVKESISLYRGTPGSITYRQYALNDVMGSISSFGMSAAPAVSLAELQNELSPRISAQELNLLVMKPMIRSKIILLDIRDQAQYKRKSAVGSINFPVASADVKLSKKSEFNYDLSQIAPHKGKIMVVIGDNMVAASGFCEYLVKNGYPKVCCLNGGIMSLIGSDIIR